MIEMSFDSIDITTVFTAEYYRKEADRWIRSLLYCFDCRYVMRNPT